MIRVMEGNAGLPKVSIASPLASAEIYLHGAQVTSWQPAGAEEVIFLSERSHWEDGKAIRGGIPVCFPWFRGKADHPQAPAHGIVRAREWELDAVDTDDEDIVTVALSTKSDTSTYRWWPHEFRLELRITVGKTLQMSLNANNTGANPFRFEEALHTYFRVGDVEHVRVRALAGATFLDNMDSNREKIQQGDVRLARQTDNAYIHTQAAAEVVDADLGHVLRTEKENSATTIVWNPWEEGSAKLTDLDDDEWRSMICVEAGNILGDAVTLDPGETHTMRSTISVVSAN